MRAAAYHADSIQLSSFLSKLPMLGRETTRTVMRMAPLELIPVLKAAGIEFVLIGAHGIAGWMEEPRATQDVDFLIRERDKAKATKALLDRYPDLKLEKHLDVWRFKRSEKYVVDLMLDRAPLYKRVFLEFIESHLQRSKIRVPKLEAALAMKFAAMTGHYRSEAKKHLAAADFIQLVRTNKKINGELLVALGELAYGGGGADVIKLVEDARAGRRLIF